MWSHYFAKATGTTISCSLGRWYGPVFSLSLLNVYGLTKSSHQSSGRALYLTISVVFSSSGVSSSGASVVDKFLKKWKSLKRSF
jgi:hypothetical protein